MDDVLFDGDPVEVLSGWVDEIVGQLLEEISAGELTPDDDDHDDGNATDK